MIEFYMRATYDRNVLKEILSDEEMKIGYLTDGIKKKIESYFTRKHECLTTNK